MALSHAPAVTPSRKTQRSERSMNASMCAALSSNPRKLGHAGQHEDDACGQHDEGREMGDHGFVSTKQKPAADGRTWRLLALRRHPAQGVSPFASTRSAIAQNSRQALLSPANLLFLRARQASP